MYSYDTTRIFLFCLFAIITATNVEEPKLIGPVEVTDEIVQSLVETTSKQALPVILFEPKEMIVPVLQPPIGIKLAEVKDGRLASGTKFYSKLADTQIFLCPKPHAQASKQCLAPKNFEESEILECEDEPTLTMFDTEESCGPDGTGTRLGFGYKICPAQEPYEYIKVPYSIYYMCYDKPGKKMISVNYNLDGRTDLFKSRLLTREREIKFEINKETYGHIDADYYANLEAEIKQKPKYKLQNLVPIEDMPLATLRKSTRYLGNFVLQHEAVFEIWNEIGDAFRNYAMSWLKRLPSEFIDDDNTDLYIPREGNLLNFFNKIIAKADQPGSGFSPKEIEQLKADVQIIDEHETAQVKLSQGVDEPEGKTSTSVDEHLSAESSKPIEEVDEYGNIVPVEAYKEQYRSPSWGYQEIKHEFTAEEARNRKVKFSKLTGVFDIPENFITTPVDESQKLNIWITILTQSTPESTNKLAVVVNNFIIKDTKNQEQYYIDTICHTGQLNLCSKNLQQKFNDAGVQGRCCLVTEEIWHLFSKNENFKQSPILYVEDVTVV